MKDKLLYSAIGGCTGAVLTLIFSLFSPLNAQNTSPDATFGKLTCTELLVRPSDDMLDRGHLGGHISLTTHQNGAQLVILGDLGVGASPGVTLDTSAKSVDLYLFEGEKSAFLRINEHGGSVGVSGKGKDTGKARMGINEYGNGAISTWDKHGYRLATLGR